VLCAVALGVCNLRRSALGQDMLAVRANERAAGAAGVNVRMTKLLGFALSAGVAGVGGVLMAYQTGWITPTTYDTFTSLALIAFGYIAGITTVAGAIFGGLIFTTGLAAFALQDWFGLQGEWFSLAAALLLIVMLSQPQGVATAVFYRDRNRARSPSVAPAIPTDLAGSRPQADG